MTPSKEQIEELKIDLGLEILCARIDANLSQSALAKKLGTKQPSISRAERGSFLTSITFLLRVANATKKHLLVSLVEDDPRICNSNTFIQESTISFV